MLRNAGNNKYFSNKRSENSLIEYSASKGPQVNYYDPPQAVGSTYLPYFKHNTANFMQQFGNYHQYSNRTNVYSQSPMFGPSLDLIHAKLIEPMPKNGAVPAKITRSPSLAELAAGREIQEILNNAVKNNLGL